MIAVVFLLWGMSLAAHTLYSHKFLYRRISDRPIAFHQQKKILSALEIIAVSLLILMTITSIPVPALVILAVSIGTRFAVKRGAYNRALREMAALQQRENQMSAEEALDVAKTLLDISIKHGQR